MSHHDAQYRSEEISPLVHNPESVACLIYLRWLQKIYYQVRKFCPVKQLSGKISKIVQAAFLTQMQLYTHFLHFRVPVNNSDLILNCVSKPYGKSSGFQRKTKQCCFLSFLIPGKHCMDSTNFYKYPCFYSYKCHPNT